MKIYALCPVSDKTVNERVARINGFFTVLLILIFGLSKSLVPILFLLIDFFLRTSEFSKYSPIAMLSGKIARYLHLSENRINAGPKIFAARIGFFISSLILILTVTVGIIPAMIFAAILGLFSLLEALFGLCVACEIYPAFYRLLYRAKFQNT